VLKSLVFLSGFAFISIFVLYIITLRCRL